MQMITTIASTTMIVISMVEAMMLQYAHRLMNGQPDWRQRQVSDCCCDAATHLWAQ